MRMKVPDDQAIASLIAFGARHRMANVWWHMKNYREVGITPGFSHSHPDKSNLAINVFVQYMEQLENLEMAYFALRDKATDPKRSFLEIYEQITIKEHHKRTRPRENSYSGRRMLLELRGMGIRRFQRELGMPTYEELKRTACGKALPEVRITKNEYHEAIRELIVWMQLAVANKKDRGMHRAFTKIKHGSLFLAGDEGARVYLVEGTRHHLKDACIADVQPLTERFLSALETDTEKIGWTVIRLLGLYLRRCPWDRCMDCKQCDDVPAEPEKTTPPIP